MMSARLRDKLEFYKQKAYSGGYNKKMCEDIKQKLQHIKPPTLNKTDITKYKTILEESNKKYSMTGNIQEKLLTVTEMIYYINSIDTDEKMQQAIKYLNTMEYIIKKVINNKINRVEKDNDITQAITILKPEIEQFIAPYTKISEGENETRYHNDTEDILEE